TQRARYGFAVRKNSEELLQIDEERIVAGTGEDLHAAGAAEDRVERTADARRDLRDAIVHCAGNRRSDGTAHFNGLRGARAVEGDLNDFVFHAVGVVVDLELVEQIRIEAGRG